MSAAVSVFGRSMAMGASVGSDGTGHNAHLVWRTVTTGKFLYGRHGLRVAGARNVHACMHVLNFVTVDIKAPCQR